MENQRDRYLLNEERDKHFEDLSMLDLSFYNSIRTYHIFFKGEFLLYTFEHTGKLEILSTYMVLEPQLSDIGGLTYMLLNKKDFRIMKVTTVPKLLRGTDITVQVPPVCRVERTAKQTADGKVLTGLTAQMKVFQKYDAQYRHTGEHYMIPLWNAERVLGAKNLQEALNNVKY